MSTRSWFSSLVVVGALVCMSTGVQAGLFDHLLEVTDDESFRVSSSDPVWEHSNGDCRPIHPGETLELADLEGPGEIEHMLFTLTNTEVGITQGLVFRAYYDDREEPGIETPFGDFFACGHGMLRSFDSLPVEVSSEGRAFNSFWPMPYKKRLRLTLTNESETHLHCVFYYIDGVKKKKLGPKVPYFHAQYRQEKPCQPGGRYLILDAEGQGHYVGTVLSVLYAEPGWFGEGDDFFFIDGEEEPSIRGTGTEDYFSDAWGFRQFMQLNHGVTIWENWDTGNHCTAYRWHIQDPVRFKKSLKVEIEHWGSQHKEDGTAITGFGERVDDFASVAFWYQTGEPKRFATLPPLEERDRGRYAIEIDNTAAKVVFDQGNLLDQPMGGCHGGSQILYMTDVPDATFTVTFSLTEPFQGLMKVLLTKSWDYGNYKITLVGQDRTTEVNLCSPDGVVSESVNMGAVRLEPGDYELLFEGQGADPKSKRKDTGLPGYYIGLDAIEFINLPPRPDRG